MGMRGAGSGTVNMKTNLDFHVFSFVKNRKKCNKILFEKLAGGGGGIKKSQKLCIRFRHFFKKQK